MAGIWREGLFGGRAARACAVLLAVLLSSEGMAASPVPTPGPAGKHDTHDRTARKSLPVAIGVKLNEDAKKTHVVIELSDPVDVHVFTLTGPNRVVVDLPEMLWGRLGNDRPSGRGTIKSYRYGLFRKGASRFVIDLNKPVRVDDPQILAPEGGSGFRLVLDLYPATQTAFAAHAGWPDASTSASAAKEAVLARAEGKRVIVLDAGHGGVDPGTHGASGLQEKAVVLAVAKQLRDVLEATGRYKVAMTRDSDVYIPLRQRVIIAHAAHADLFVSLHADSNDHREISGASVYTLSEAASDKEAAKLAEKENMSDAVAGVDLTDQHNPVASFLVDLTQRDTMNRSVRFAETVLSSLDDATAVRQSTPHRSAGFAVLKAPDIPAVLVELGYLTNSGDERAMATVAWRKRVAEALGNAIDRHFGLETAPHLRQAANP